MTQLEVLQWLISHIQQTGPKANNTLYGEGILDIFGKPNRFWGRPLKAEIIDDKIIVWVHPGDFNHYVAYGSVKAEKMEKKMQLIPNGLLSFVLNETPWHFPHGDGVKIEKIITSQNLQLVAKLSQAPHQPKKNEVIYFAGGYGKYVIEDGELYFSSNSIVELENKYDYFYKSKCVDLSTGKIETRITTIDSEFMTPEEFININKTSLLNAVNQGYFPSAESHLREIRNIQHCIQIYRG